MSTTLVRIAILIAVLSIAAPAAMAQTNVPGGTLATDTTWTLAGSPYVVQGALTVAGTDGGDAVTTLTIEPGVEVRFVSGAALIVGNFTDSGALVADGDAAGGPATILFTSDAATPAPGNWRGIETENIHASTILRNVEIRYAGQSSRAGVYGSHDPSQTLVVDQATIRDCSTQGIRFVTGRIDVSNSTIQGNAQNDVEIANSLNVGGSFSNNTLGNVRYQGVTSPPIAWSGNDFVDYGAIPSRIDVDDLADFSTNNTFTKVPNAVTQVIGGTAGRDGTWTLAAAPYVVESVITIQGESSVPAAITIEPGVEMRFNSGTALVVGGTATRPGNLIADGNAAGGPATIRFTSSSTTPAPGNWRGIEFEVIDASSLLRNVEIRYAGQASRAGVYASHGAAVTLPVEQATIRDCSTQGLRAITGGISVSGSTIQDNLQSDVQIDNSAFVSGSFTNNTIGSVVYTGGTADPIAWSGNAFVDYGAITSRIDVDDLAEFTSNNTFTKVPGAFTEVLGGSASRSGTWAVAASPYVVQSLITIRGDGGVPATITIEPGVEMRFPSAGALVAGGTAAQPGNLIADGNAAGGPATILFTSSSTTPAPGDWRGVEFEVIDASSLLRNVEIRYAGQSSRAGVYCSHDAAVTLPVEQATIRDSLTYGVYVITGGISVSDSTIQDNLQSDVYISNGSSLGASFTNNTLGSAVYLGTGAPPITWSGNDFVDYGAIPSRIDPDDLGEFSSNNTFFPVAGAVTEVLGGTAERDATWSVAASPYRMLGFVTVLGSPGGALTTVTIEPGSEFRFDPNAYLAVGTTGTRPAALIADGDGPGGPATIRFTANSDAPASGFWRGIETGFAMNGATVLRNAEILYAGSLSSRPALFANHASGVTLTLDTVSIRDSATEGIRISNGDVSVTDSTIRDNGSLDVELSGSTNVSASFVGNVLESVNYATASVQPIVWSGNTFDNWGARTSRIRIAELDAFTRDNTFNPVPGAVLDVFGGTLDVDATWGAAAGPLIFDNTVRVQGTDGPDGVTTLTLEPGVSVRVPPAGTFIVGGVSSDPGELIADGAPGGAFAGTINFGVDSDVPNAGDWNGIDVLATGRAVLRHVQVRYATEGIAVDGVLGAPSTNVTVNRSNVGLDLDGAVVEGGLDLWSFRNTDIGVRALSTDVTFRDGNLVGATFGAQNLSPGTHCIDAESNWWGAASGPSGSAPAVGCEIDTPAGTGSPITEGVLFGNFLTVTPDDGDSIACDDGDGFADPCTGGNTVGCDDNCCGVSNESQADEDGDGVGDACDANPVLRVSSDPADAADFTIVQDAVDVSVQSGTRVEILPGLGPYSESVRLDRSQVYSFVGVTNLAQDPIVVDGGTGAAFRVINKVGSAPMSFRGLTLRGGQGIRSSVDTSVADVAFDGVTGEALQLDGGAHTAERIAVGPTVGAAARVEQGASLTARRVDVRGATDVGFDAAGALTLENVLVGGGVDGVRLSAGGTLDARYVTLANNTGVGVDASAGGTVGSIDRSIVHGNAIDDLVAVACGVVTWSDVGSPDCSVGGDNLSADPLLGLDYRPGAGSPCLDHGPDPSTYAGDPPTDLAGGPRIADHDGDGFAVNDCGAFEIVNAELVPGEVANLRWDFDFRLLWDAEPDAVEYHVYRDLLANLAYTSFGTCRDDLDGDRTDLQLDDLDEPAPGAGFFYLITAQAIGGEEGTLGFATTAERSNFNACP